MVNIHPLATVHPGAKLGNNVEIGPYAFIDDNVEIGDVVRYILTLLFFLTLRWVRIVVFFQGLW